MTAKWQLADPFARGATPTAPRRDLSEGDVAYLEEVIAAAARRFNPSAGTGAAEVKWTQKAMREVAGDERELGLDGVEPLGP